MLDEKVFQEEHTRTVETKLTKNIGLVSAQRLYLKKNLLEVFILHIVIYT